MAHEVKWTKLVLDEFIKEALLEGTIDEMIMRTRVKGWSREKQAQEFHMSIASIDKRISLLKKRYDEVAKYDPLLPPRKREPGEIFQGFGR